MYDQLGREAAEVEFGSHFSMRLKPMLQSDGSMAMHLGNLATVKSRRDGKRVVAAKQHFI